MRSTGLAVGPDEEQEDATKAQDRRGKGARRTAGAVASHAKAAVAVSCRLGIEQGLQPTSDGLQAKGDGRPPIRPSPQMGPSH